MLSRYGGASLLLALVPVACSSASNEADIADGAVDRPAWDASIEDGRAPPTTDARIDGLADTSAVDGPNRDAARSTDAGAHDVGDASSRDAIATDDARDVAIDATRDALSDAQGDAATQDAAVGRDVGDAGAAVSLDTALRFKRLEVRPVGSSRCLTASATSIALENCGGAAQDWRAELLGAGYVALVDDGTGSCVTARNDALVLTECTHEPAQQFAFAGTAARYQFTSLESKLAIAADLRLGSSPGKFELRIQGEADPLAVVADERPIGWAAMAAKIVIAGLGLPTGNEKQRDASPTTGGGSWESAQRKNFSNVTWFKPADFAASSRETAISAVATALKASGPSIVLFEEGTYDFSLTTPKKMNRCNASCSGGGTYTQVGGFCPDDTTCASTAGCVVGGYQDPYRTLDVGSDKTILGLGRGAVFRRLGLRFMGQHNVIYRNVAHREMPGGVRAWDDGLLFWPADHVWVDHVSFSGFGRGAVVLSGTRVADGASFYAWRDSGWMTFSWIAVDSTESWRCDNKEDSPYPFFTTNDPSLTFHHALFLAGHGRNPAIDGESAHFFNCAWSGVSDGLDGRGGAKLLVEGSWFDGDRPIRMDDPAPPTVLAPIDPKSPSLGDPRRLNLLSARADSSLRSDWKARGIDVNTLNTNAVAAPSYPYSLDTDPARTQATVIAGAGIGKAGFPVCNVNAGSKNYVCK